MSCLFESFPESHTGLVECEESGCPVKRDVVGDAWDLIVDPPLTDCIQT